jgi:hypothetical protein
MAPIVDESVSFGKHIHTLYMSYKKFASFKNSFQQKSLRKEIPLKNKNL